MRQAEFFDDRQFQVEFSEIAHSRRADVDESAEQMLETASSGPPQLECKVDIRLSSRSDFCRAASLAGA